VAEPHWAGYVGMVTGLIGAITGIAGAIMGYVSYRRSNRFKALDLRLELRKAVNDIHAEIPQLRELIDKANRSRRNVSAARGMRGSGRMGIWDDEIKADRGKIVKLSNRAPKPESNYHTMSEKELESELVTVHQLQGEIRSLRDKYSEAIRSDEEQSKQLREDERARFSPHP
jgi:hypothetical protein